MVGRRQVDAHRPAAHAEQEDGRRGIALESLGPPRGDEGKSGKRERAALLGMSLRNADMEARVRGWFLAYKQVPVESIYN